MIKEFNYYLNNNLVIKASVNKNLSNALIEKAENRIKFSIKERKINEKNASFVFEDIYECLREAFQSLMALKGYKPLSHECIVAFLKKFCSFSQKDIESFNNYRILRNKSMYGGEKISSNKCNEALRFLIEIFPQIKKEVENEI